MDIQEVCLRITENKSLVLGIVFYIIDQIFEYWLGKTNKVRAASKIELIQNLFSRGNKMDLRKELGGKLEDALNKVVDEKLQGLGKDFVKAKVTELIDKLIEENYDKLLGGLAEKLKSEIIDKIDGEDDIPAVTPPQA